MLVSQETMEFVMAQDSSLFRPVYSIADIAALTGLSKPLIYKEINAGHLVIRKAGRRTLVHADDLAAWLNALPKRRPSRSTAA